MKIDLHLFSVIHEDLRGLSLMEEALEMNLVRAEGFGWLHVFAFRF
jgi:hypothetical protein